MHHPEQFNLVARSILDDRLRAAASGRYGKKAGSPHLNRQARLPGSSWQPRLGRLFSQATMNLGRLSTRMSFSPRLAQEQSARSEWR